MHFGFDEIYEYIRQLRIMDSHEHLHPEGSMPNNGDILYRFLQHYIWSDVQSAGLKVKKDKFGQPLIQTAMDPAIPVKERWMILEPFWEASRYTGYGQALDVAARDLFDVERIDRTTIEDLAVKFSERNQPGYYHKVLREHCKIDTVVNDDPSIDFRNPLPFASDSLFRYVIRFPEFLNYEEWLTFEQITGTSVSTLKDFDNACDKFVETARAHGIVALKCAYAYRISLQFGKDDTCAAKDALAHLLNGENWDLSYVKQLQRYCAHRFLSLANKYEMVVQIHTGLLESSVEKTTGSLVGSNPINLEPLFKRYPNVKFDLLHLYPFHHVAASLAKMYANVYLDMGWTHISSPPAAITMLDEWLETIPRNKILGFGGDYCFVEGSYGHQYIARRNIARVLAKKIDNHLFTPTQAQAFAQDLLYNNTKNLFSI